MGSLGKKPTIGHEYHLGMHLVLGQAADALLEVKFGDKSAWAGYHRTGALVIDKPELFGGKKKEGGVSGTIDFLPGGPSQARNSYLQAVLGASIPAFRGVVSAVFR